MPPGIGLAREARSRPIGADELCGSVSEDFTFKLNVTVRAELWTYLSMGASLNHISLDEAVSYCLDSGTEVCDWANDDFALPELDIPNHGPANDQPSRQKLAAGRLSRFNTRASAARKKVSSESIEKKKIKLHGNGAVETVASGNAARHGVR